MSNELNNIKAELAALSNEVISLRIVVDELTETSISVCKTVAELASIVSNIVDPNKGG